MKTFVRLLGMVSLAAVLAGCASTPDHSQWIAMEQSRQARLDAVAAQCQTDLCLVMVAQEQGRAAIRPPTQQYHPAWQIADRALSLAIPAYFGARQTRDLVQGITGVAGIVAGIDRADQSITVGGHMIGGDQIDDRSVAVGGDQIGRDRIDDRSVVVGADQIGGDRIDDRSVGGNQVGGDGCIGPECRVTSPGPIDNSNNSDNSDNSSNNQPEPP